MTADQIMDSIIKLGAAGAVVWGFIRFVWPALRWFYRGFQRIVAAADEVLGSGEQPGLRALVDGQGHRLTRLEREILPNGGGSVSDRMAMAITWIQSVLDADTARGHFYLDKRGELTWANRSLARWLGANADDLEGRGWIGFIHADDRDAAATEWARMLKDERIGTFTARFSTGIPSTGAGAWQRLTFTARPQFGSSGHLIGFTGRVRHADSGDDE